ncbi:unnamed protein product [Diamesa hyperborea]
MAYKRTSTTDELELVNIKTSSNKSLNENENENDNRKDKKPERSVNFASDIDVNGNKMPKAKNVQFSSPQVSFEAEVEIEAKPNLIPNRKREEAMVMDNLRKRVGDLLLDKNFKQKPRADEEVENEEEQPFLEKELGFHYEVDQTTEMNFIVENLCWNNEYRARHSTPALILSPKLCDHAQQWANHLANINALYYCGRNFNFGQNIFCCPETSLYIDLSGQEVATYWYQSLKRYDYNKPSNLLHTNINTGPFTQIIWANSKYFGAAKSISRVGKIFVVAYYYPPGNIIGEYERNVLPPTCEEKEVSRPPSENSNK